MDHKFTRKSRTTITKETIGMINNQIMAGKSNKEISESLNISYNTIRKMRNKITQGEDESSIIKGKGRRFTNNENAIASQLLGIVLNNNLLTQNGMAEELTKFGVKKSQSTISRMLIRAGVTCKRLVKVPEERNCPRILTLRQQYAQQLQHYASTQLVYLDDTGFNLHTNQNYGYSLKDTKAFITVPANRGQSASLMAVISVDGIIGWQLINGAYAF